MRRAYRKIWRAVPCASKKSLQTESSKDIEEILNAKLATIMEEPETSCDRETSAPHTHWSVVSAKKVRVKNRVGCLLLPQFSFKESCALLATGFASKGRFVGLLRY